MPSLIDLRRRIRSVKNTEQITKAMKMVSAAKLRRAQERVIAARPYANLMREMLSDIAAAALLDDRASESPWLAAREAKRVDLFFFSSDTGLAGAFNSSLLKASQKFFRGPAGRGNQADARRPQGTRLLSPPQRRHPLRAHQYRHPPHIPGCRRDRAGSNPALPGWRNGRCVRPQQRIQKRHVAEAVGHAVAAGGSESGR